MLVAASSLCVGDLVRYDPYTVEIVAPPVPGNLFGQPLQRFAGKIVGGPDRIGDEGLLSFGPGGVANLLRRHT